MQQNIIGESPTFLSVLDQVSQLARIERSVLIVGERGTGKELIAQRLHYLSKRWDKPLITLNCAALNEGVMDSELFGHESGAFTGSKGRHQGRFERAESGTLFLDELATMSMVVQEKLLRVIEYGQYERLGGNQSLTADVRIVCATNANLPQLVEEECFRADLLDRLAFDVIQLPPLRHRKEDILPLANYYATKMCHELELSVFVGFSSHAMKTLQHYSWPGNIRELKNVVERAVYQHGKTSTPINTLVFNPFDSPWQHDIETSKNLLAEGCDKKESVNLVSPLNLEKEVYDESNPTSLIIKNNINFPIDYKRWQQEQEQALLQQALLVSKFNQRDAAQLLGLSYHQLRGMIRKYKLSND